MVIENTLTPLTLTTIEVTSTGDSGPGTLRNAIEEANANSTTDLISFNIPGDGPHTFRPKSPYPALTGSTIIDGYSQPGSAEASAFTSALLKLELDGTHAGDGANGILITGGNSTVKGLVINRFDGSGIRMEGAGGNVVEGNYIGTDVDGLSDLGNGSVGVWVYDIPNNRIGGTSVASRNVISGNGSSGVYLYRPGATGNLVHGNYIGVNAQGSNAMGNYNGVGISGASDNTVGGTTSGARNVISGNRTAGVKISRQNNDRARSNLVQGNYIGLNAAGTAGLGNGSSGVSLVQAEHNTIGGTVAGARNVISSNGIVPADQDGYIQSNDTHGVHIIGNFFQNGNTVQGNYIGTDRTGTIDLGNRSDGVYIEGSSYNLIGGSVSGARNIISGNICGVRMVLNTGSIPAVASHDNVVMGNFLGTDPTGTAAVPNLCGVSIGAGHDNTIGGAIAGEGNLISGNSFSGVSISGPDTRGNLVLGNKIGVNASGSVALANGGTGVGFTNGAHDNTVGGTGTGAGNTIAFNSGPGIVAHPGTLVSNNQLLGESVTNRITGNSVYGNGQLVIDLGEDGVTPNDAGLDDGGPGDYQNYPVLSVAAGSTTVEGTLQSNADSQFQVEFFSNSSSDPSGHGEGQTYLGAQNVVTNGSGSASFSFATGASVGEFITATATGPGSNTSECSACVQLVAAAPTPTPTPTPAPSGPQTELDFGSSGGTEGGSGDFSTFVPQNDRAIIGTIPVGIKDLVINLTAENDLDIELWDGDTFVVGWISDGISAQISSLSEITGDYNGVDITWSGWNGVDGQLGNEFIRLSGTTANSFVIKAFGYREGDVDVVYSWSGTGGSGPAPSGTGSFSKGVTLGDRATIGTIPAGIQDLYIQLTATADLDIELWDGENFVVGWQSDGISAQIYSSK